MESFCASVLKPHDKITFEIQFTWFFFFPWEPADEYLRLGKGGKIQTIVRFSVQTLIILNLVSWNGLQSIKRFIFLKDCTVRDLWEIILWISYSVFRRYTFHYTHIPTYAAYNNVHLFQVDFLKHDLVQYSLMIQYGPIFSTHQHEHKTSMQDNSNVH